MMKLKKAARLLFNLLFFAALSLPVQAAAVCDGKACFEDRVMIGGIEVPLRGTGMLEFLKFDMYSAALYIPENIQGIDAVLDAPLKRLELSYHRSIKVEWMNKAAAKIMEKNPDVDFEAIRERVEQISAAYKRVEKGDRYALQYEALSGTTLLLNEEPQITIPGADFARAYFGIWLSEYPANTHLRDALINYDPGT